MDYDNSSFEDTSLSSGKKFIALVVSDHSDMEDSGILESSIEPTFSNPTANSSNHNILLSNTITNPNINNTSKDKVPPTDPSNAVLRRPQNKNKSRDATKRYSMMIPDSKAKIDSLGFDQKSPLLRANHPSSNNNSTQHNTPKNEDKKRWSFMSNHSSSSKKRWSALSSFTTDSVSSSNASVANNSTNNSNTPGNRHSIHSSNKRFSTTSNISSATTTTSTNNTEVISFQNKNNSIDNISNHTGKSNSSMKRSSTGSSLRQFLTNIVTPSDHINNSSATSSANNNNNNNSNNSGTNLDPQYNKENQYSPNQHNNSKAKTKIHTTTPVVQAQSRNPLQKIAVNDKYVNTNNMPQPNNRTSRHYDNTSLYSSKDGNLTSGQLNQSMDNLTLRSKRSSISSMSSSSSLSKWKFWKKNSNSYNNSTNHHHHHLSQSQQDPIYTQTLAHSTSSRTINVSSYSSNGESKNNRLATSHIPQSHSSRTIHNQLSERPLSTYSHETNKLRSKNSLSDFHKSFYSSGNGSIGTSIHNIAEMKSEFSFYSNVDHADSGHNISLKKKSSTSSLSMSVLKHRTSQHSLKHKTSHSSLTKFKSRRKSNNDDSSSFLTMSSSINSGHSSSGGASSNPKISLPIPNQVSRDKIRTKLKNSTSLLSLNSHIPVEKKTYDITILNQLLQLCSVEYAICSIDLDSEPHKHLEIFSSNHSIQLSNHTWRSTSVLDPNQTVICKKFVLANDDDEVILKELQMLYLCKGTPGLPQLLQSYIVTTNNSENILYVFLKDHGNPITETVMASWSQCLKIFWQCVNILYAAETKFQFEHRNLTLNHILMDKNGTVTLCDLSMSRANYSKDAVLFTRLDHPVFFQSGHDYLFDTYHSMRSVFILHDEQWNSFEPRTNLLWLRYVAINLLTNNKNNKQMGPGREQLTKIITLLDNHCSLSGNKRGSHLFGKRKEFDIKSAGDLLRYK